MSSRPITTFWRKPLGSVGVQWGRGEPAAPAIVSIAGGGRHPRHAPNHGTQLPSTRPRTMAGLGTRSSLRLLCLRHFLLFEESALIKTSIKTQQSAQDPVTISTFHKWHHSFIYLLDIITCMFNNVLNLPESKSWFPPNLIFPKTSFL